MFKYAKIHKIECSRNYTSTVLPKMLISQHNYFRSIISLPQTLLRNIFQQLLKHLPEKLSKYIFSQVYIERAIDMST